MTPNAETEADSAALTILNDLPLQFFDIHVFVQLNDVYFLDARADYARPDGLLLPRIATIVKRLKQALPGRVTVCVPGDFLAPSCLGKLSSGRHMVETFNQIGVDLVTLGNHEFEQAPLTPATLAENIASSGFRWLCGNFEAEAPELKAVFDRQDKVGAHEIIELREGLVAAVFGVTLADDYKKYGRATDPIAKTQDIIREIRASEPAIANGESEAVFIALTHQDAPDDVLLAERYPDLTLIMGGHDHDKDVVVREERPAIVKAASNARTLRLNVLMHRQHISWEPQPRALWLQSRSLILNRVFQTLTQAAVDAAPASVRELIVPPGERVGHGVADGFVDDTRLRSGFDRVGDFDVGLYSFAIEAFLPALVDHIPEDPETRACIDRWEAFWDETSGTTRDPILVLPGDFHARDAEVRRTSTNAGNLAADALRVNAAGNEVAPIGLLNSGSLRIDRNLPAGETVTARTVGDLLFFDNTVQTHNLPGRVVWRILRKSLELRAMGGAEGGHGDFLQISGLSAVVASDALVRVIAGEGATEADLPEDDSVWRVATTDYVAASKHYKSFFLDNTGPPIGSYNRMFEAALGRLGAGGDAAWARIAATRWVES